MHYKLDYKHLHASTIYKYYYSYLLVRYEQRGFELLLEGRENVRVAYMSWNHVPGKPAVTILKLCMLLCRFQVCQTYRDKDEDSFASCCFSVSYFPLNAAWQRTHTYDLCTFVSMYISFTTKQKQNKQQQQKTTNFLKNENAKIGGFLLLKFVHNFMKK